MNEEVKKTELVYTKAKLRKRIGASFIDIFLIFFLTFVGFSITNMVIPYFPFYNDLLNERDQIYEDSYLYKDQVLISEYIQSNEEFETTEEKKEYLREHIDLFYYQSRFIDDKDKIKEEYAKRKLDYTLNDLYLFEENENGDVVEKSVNPSYLVTFYTEEIENYALMNLFNDETYILNTQSIYLISILNIFIWFILMSFVFLYVFPAFIFKRGRKTIGMKIFKIGFIGVNALNVSVQRYSSRYVFTILVMYILDIFAFLIPLFVSLGMMYFSKREQNLIDYLFNTYVVDTTNDEIYLNYGEYLDKTNFERSIKLEDKDLKIGN